MKTAELISRKYRLLGLLAEGGMGEVWSARNERTNREVAVKFLLPELARNPEALHRFVREAKATGQLRHPNIVAALDAGMHDGRPYLVMELLAGESLEARILREKRLDPIETCILLAQVARALGHAHQAGIVHRDLSAANVFLSVASEGTPVVKVLDFGVSKVTCETKSSRIRTSTGAVLGSPSYMSPEQAGGAEMVDTTTDLWSLGVLAYQCISGKLPFEGRNYNALMQAIVHQPHEPLTNRIPDADPALVELVESCLVKDRTLRVGSARDLARELEAVALRLSQVDRRGAYMPMRREVDRAASPESNWKFRRALPPAVLPMPVRAFRALCQLPPSVLLVGGLLGGGSLAVATMSLFSSKDEGFPLISYVTGSVCEDKGEKVEVAADTKKAAVSPSVVAATSETDLVHAVARALNVPVTEPEMLPSTVPVLVVRGERR